MPVMPMPNDDRKKYERAVTYERMFVQEGLPAVPWPPNGDETWELMAVMPIHGPMVAHIVCYWQREMLPPEPAVGSYDPRF